MNDANGATEIDECTVINESGTYVLTQNITDSKEERMHVFVSQTEPVT